MATGECDGGLLQSHELGLHLIGCPVLAQRREKATPSLVFFNLLK